MPGPPPEPLPWGAHRPFSRCERSARAQVCRRRGRGVNLPAGKTQPQRGGGKRPRARGASTCSLPSHMKEHACLRRPAQPLLTSPLVNQRAGSLPPCWWSRGRVMGSKAAVWKAGVRSGGQPQARRAAVQSPGLVEVLLSALHMALHSPLGAALLSYPPWLPPGRCWKRCAPQWQKDFLACVLPIEKVEAEGRLQSQVITLF